LLLLEFLASSNTIWVRCCYRPAEGALLLLIFLASSNRVWMLSSCIPRRGGSGVVVLHQSDAVVKSESEECFTVNQPKLEAQNENLDAKSTKEESGLPEDKMFGLRERGEL
jgi:hypothetical protein